MVKEYIEDRVLELADYLISNKSTVRNAAKKYGCSKSTVHKDLVERLPSINLSLTKQVKEILEFNKAERHIRGGEATKLRYSNNKAEA